METFKDKLLFTFGIVVLLGVCGLAYYLLVVHTSLCYTQIDNSQVSKIDNNEYKYELTAYDEHGKIQQVEFKAPRELREDAYLKLETMWVRGVISWEEVQYEDLPYDVKSRYPATE